MALIIGVLLIPTALGLAKVDRDRDVSELERALVAETDEHGGALESYFARARAIVLLTANSPAFADVLAEPGTRLEKIDRQDRSLREVTHHLRYLEQLYPNSIGEACFIDTNGEEFARAVRGEIAPPDNLSTEEEQTVFFAPTFALDFGQVHQTQPYISPDTAEWVVANATLIPQADGVKRAFVHFEVTVESFRREMGASAAATTATDYQLRIIDGRTGAVIIDGSRPQRIGAALGAAGDDRFAGLAGDARSAGVTEIDGRRTAFRHITATAGNANDWIVVATAASPHRQLRVERRTGAKRDARDRGADDRAGERLASCFGSRARVAGQLGRLDQAGQPPQVPRRPRPPRPQRLSGGTRCADDVRPQRIQELQRQLRPPRRRRAAAAPGRRAAETP